MASTSGTKRRHKTLPLQEKWNIIMRVANGETPTSIARQYDIGRATVHDILKNKDKIAEFLQSENSELERKTLKMSEYPEVEKAVLMWYKQEISKNIPISGEQLKQKAQLFYKKMTNKDNFRASDGWLENFKKRNGIRFLKPVKPEDNSKFIENLCEKIAESNLGPEQIYCAFGAGLNWWGDEPAKTGKSRLNLILCANAAGTKTLKMHVANHDIKLTSDKLSGLCTYAKSHIRGPDGIFMDWCQNYFEPEVLKELTEKGLPLKALLLVDANMPGYPVDLKLSLTNIEVMQLPKTLNVDQTVLQTFKALYRKHVIMWNASSAWKEVKPITLINFWRNLWPAHPLLPEEPVNDNEMNKAINEALEKCKEAATNHQFQSLTVEDLQKWVLQDDLNKNLGDEDIIKAVSECKEELEAKRIKLADESVATTELSNSSRSLQSCAETEPNSAKLHQYIAGPIADTSNRDALIAANTVLQWLTEKGIVGDQISAVEAIKQLVATELGKEAKNLRGKMIETSPNLANLPNLTHISNLAHLSNLANMTKYGNNMISLEDEEDSRSHSPILSIAYPEVCMKDVSSDEDAGSYNSLDNPSATNNHSSVSTEGEIRGRRGTHGSEDSSQGGPLALGLDLDEAAAARMLAALKSVEDPIARHRFRSKLHYLSEECELTALKVHRDIRKEM